MHQMKFGEYYFRTVVLDLVEAPKKTTVVSLAVLLEPNGYKKTLIEVGSSHLYASFGTFWVQIGQLVEAQ